MNVVKHRRVNWIITAWFPIIGLVLFATCTVAAVAPLENVQSPGVFTICDVGNAPGDVPRNASAALRSLIAWRVACQDELTLLLDTELQSLTDELGEEVDSVFFATESLLLLEEEIISFQAVVLSPEADSQTLDTSLTQVLVYVDTLEVALNAIGDDAQLADVDLQNWLQKQQQTLQMMSNISKMLHDTAMAVIRKIGG